MSTSTGAGDNPTALLERWKAITEAATRAPWSDQDSDDFWQLFGALADGMHPLQLIKAPKCGTPYAEYWPDPADAEFIVTARTAMPLLLAAVEKVLKAADDWEWAAAKADRRSDKRGEQGDDAASALLGGRATALRQCAQEFREAIRGALAGEAGNEPQIP